MKFHVFWPTTVQAVALFASTGLSIWAAVIARTRRGVPGGTAFSWMMLAVAWWTFTSAMHTLIDDYDTRVDTLYVAWPNSARASVPILANGRI